MATLQRAERSSART